MPSDAVADGGPWASVGGAEVGSPKVGERAREAEGGQGCQHSSVCLAPLLLLLEAIPSRSVAMPMDL